LRHDQKTKPKNRWGEERAEIKTKGTETLFNEIIAENFPHLGKDMDIQVDMTRKEPLHITLLLRCQDYRSKKGYKSLKEENDNLLTKTNTLELH
jgi:hypothetical protein